MRTILLFTAVLPALCSAGCVRERTQVMLGVITNLFAPGELSQVRMSITRNDVPIQDRVWSIPGTLLGDYQLPGSVGIYSEDGSSIDVAVTVTGFRGPASDPLLGSPMTVLVKRQAQFTLVPGQTLFTRLALAVNCVSSLDANAPKSCATGQTCVEGRCVQELQDARRFPAYESGMERAIMCRSGREARDYHFTESASPDQPREVIPKLPLWKGGACAAGESCIEGTCYKPEPGPVVPDGDARDQAAPAGDLRDGGDGGPSDGAGAPPDASPPDLNRMELGGAPADGPPVVLSDMIVRQIDDAGVIKAN